ncbi:MAG TPA: LuxR C-terminal-related transcriptional regulator [Aldersonia sp.]
MTICTTVEDRIGYVEPTAYVEPSGYVEPAGYDGPAADTALRWYPTPTLSHRECEVVLAWLRSDSKAVVAAHLFISIGTVNTHLARIRSKYAAVGRPAPTKAALFARALQDGLTELRDW